MATFSDSFDQDDNSPDCIQLSGPPPVDLTGNVGISAPDVPVTDYYIAYSAESIFTRHGIAHPSNTPNFHVVYWDGTDWFVWDFTGTADEAMLPIATDRLIAGISNGSVTQLSDGVFQGIETLSNFAGFSFINNSFNGTFNTGEVDIVAGATSALPASGVIDKAEKQLDGTYVVESDGSTLTVQEAIDAGWEPCEEAVDTDRWMISEECYEFEEITPLSSTTTNTRNVGPALTGFVASFDAPVDNYRLLSFRATVDGVGSGNFTVTNLTTGETSDTSSENWAGPPPTVTARTFTLDTPVSASAGDIITLASNVTGNARWRYTFTTAGAIRQGTVGSATGPAFSMAGFTVGEIFISERYDVQTYEDLDGNITYVQTDENGVRSDLAAIPAEWTLCVEKEMVSDDCYLAPTADFEYVSDTNTSANGNMTQASGASAPSSAPFRITNSGPIPFLLQGFRIRYGANGYTGTGAVTILGEVFNEVGQSDISGVYRTLEFAPANGVGVVFNVGDSHNSGGGSNHGALTGGFQGPVLTGYGGDNLFPAGNIARAELDVVGGTPVEIEQLVRCYTDGTFAVVDKAAKTVTPLAAIPAEWTPAAHTDCEDHSSLTDRIDALENTVGVSYEYQNLWAEEGGTLSGNNPQWSWGNGDVGIIGLPVGAGWEVIEMSYDADFMAPPSNIEVALMDFSDAANVTQITSISLTGAADGGGQTNNAWKIDEYATPVPINGPAKLGFQTVSSAGFNNSARVGVRLRRLIT